MLIILSSYQAYTANITRSKRDYEAEFKNIKYSKVEEIKKDKNIKEVSVTYEIGTSAENIDTESSKGSTRVNIIAYDENSIKNNKVKLIEGRYPENTSEIVISQHEANGIVEVGQELELTINGNKKTYTVVGKAEELLNDYGDFSFNFIAGAITYFDESTLMDDSLVNVSIITKNINKIKDTVNNLTEDLRLYESQEEKESNLIYNKTLLNYSMIRMKNKEDESIYVGDRLAEEFAADVTKIFAGTIIVVAIASTIVIYTSFKISYSSRVKELGILASIGMNKKQRRKMLLKEAMIVCTIGIILGLIIGIVISSGMIKIIDMLFQNIGKNSPGTKLLIDSSTTLNTVIPFKAIILTIIFAYIITIIASFLPTKRINKISPIEAIRNSKDSDVTRKQVKVTKFVEKIFKEEGVLAYKNIRRDKSNYKTIVVSIVISIILFVTVNYMLVNFILLYGEDASILNKDIEYNLSFSYNYDEEKNLLLKKLSEKNLLDNYIIIRDIMIDSQDNLKIVIPEEKITNDAQLINSKGYCKIGKIENDLLATTRVMVVEGKEYDDILQELGIDKLGLDECIINDRFAIDTKYGKNIKMTNFKEGEKITVRQILNNSYPISYQGQDEEIVKETQEMINNMLGNIGENTNQKNQNKEMKQIDYNLKIVGIANNVTKDSKLAPTFSICNIIISEETAKKWGVEEDYKDDETLRFFSNMYINTDKPEEIDDVIEEMRDEAEKEDKKLNLHGDSFYKDYKKEAYIGFVKKMLIYTFICLIAILSCINIFITIASSISLRKKDFAELKSLGMSNKQINKMLMLEGLFYGLDVVIYSLIIGVAILYLIYVIVIDKSYNIKPFVLPYMDFVICIIVTYVVIFASIIFTKRKIKTQNIVEEIKEENI